VSTTSPSQSESNENLNKNKDEDTSISPYYVNDTILNSSQNNNNYNSLVRLPSSLSFVKQSEISSYNKNNEDLKVNPAILRIVGSISPSSSSVVTNKSINNRVVNFSKKNPRKESVINSNNNELMGSKSRSIYSKNLNYVVAETVHNLNKPLSTIENNNKNNDNNNQFEYTVIHMNKTPAIQYSQEKLKQRRLEYVRLNRNKEKN
jgi:hypothetical protein